mgnify:CR=1 FL=1
MEISGSNLSGATSVVWNGLALTHTFDGATGSITAAQQETAARFTQAKVVAKGGEAIGPIAEDAIAIGAKVLWMQLGVVNEEVAAKARAAGRRQGAHRQGHRRRPRRGRDE